ncbi:DUF3992 domain-containing protein [Peribacillus asahii]|uniref:DUF3992 domain-containing protein n=1 Tax=Peribacillus asahii TaxID=228899 RepID=UPI00207A01CB|nr:S-Ena type endospore appendage [Peribacillus asahii]USK86718.1 DUF3992 domain-containing protein [Peribacillus asahii]
MANLGGFSNNPLNVISDSVSCSIELGDTNGAATTIWQDDTPFVINGTIVVENTGTMGVSPKAALHVNGAAIRGFVVAPGECRSVTVNDLRSISIVASGTGTAKIKISFSLNYKF